MEESATTYAQNVRACTQMGTWIQWCDLAEKPWTKVRAPDIMIHTYPMIFLFQNMLQYQLLMPRKREREVICQAYSDTKCGHTVTQQNTHTSHTKGGAFPENERGREGTNLTPTTDIERP
jgi:hypothetical protein